MLLADIYEQFGGLVAYLGEEDSMALIRLVTKAFGYFTAQTTMQKESENGR
jgi:hypothetical protein